jgi:hypothetical protein
MNNDHNTGNDDNAFMIGQALSGRHLLDSPLEASPFQGSTRFNGDGASRGHSNTPRPLPRPPMRRMESRGMAERPPVSELPQPVIEQRAVAAAPVKAPQPEFDGEDDGDDLDDLNSNGLASRAGCPRGWLISEAELEKRFAKLGARFEDVEVDTEADRRVIPIQPARPRASASYTSLFDLPRRARGQ